MFSKILPEANKPRLWSGGLAQRRGGVQACGRKHRWALNSLFTFFFKKESKSLPGLRAI